MSQIEKKTEKRIVKADLNVDHWKVAFAQNSFGGLNLSRVSYELTTSCHQASCLYHSKSKFAWGNCLREKFVSLDTEANMVTDTVLGLYLISIAIWIQPR